MSKPVFEKPYGPGKRHHSLYSSTPDDGATCEFCDTTYDGPGFRMGYLLGREIIMECCGKFVDDLFSNLGLVFAQSALEDMAANPTSGAAKYLLIVLEGTLATARRNLAAAQEDVDSAQTALASLTS